MEIRTEIVKANQLEFEVDQCGQGSKLALCLHGFPEHSFSWRYQLPILAELGFEAWAPNLRGYGNSSMPEGVESYAMNHLLQDVAGLIDAAGHEEVVLIAHDWGAVIAWQFAMREVRPLSKLVICNVPHPGPMSQAFKNGWQQLLKSWYVFFFQLPRLPEWMLGRNQGAGAANAIYNSAVDKTRFPPEVMRVYQDNAARPGGLTAMVNYYRALLKFRHESVQEPFPNIKVPTLMIWGEDDVALSKASTYGTADYVDNFQIRYLPRVSHWVQQEAPEAVNAMLEAFLQEREIPEYEWRLQARD